MTQPIQENAEIVDQADLNVIEDAYPCDANKTSKNFDRLFAFKSTKKKWSTSSGKAHQKNHSMHGESLPKCKQFCYLAMKGSNSRKKVFFETKNSFKGDKTIATKLYTNDSRMQDRQIESSFTKNPGSLFSYIIGNNASRAEKYQNLYEEYYDDYKPNSFQKLAKQHNRGNLKQKNLQQWLNNILIESTPN